jgi:hypothetical protein
MAKAFFNLPYWALLVLAVILLITTPFLNSSVNLSPRSSIEKLRLKEKRVKRRKWYFSIVLVILALYFNLANPQFELVLGKNNLGVSETVGTILLLTLGLIFVYFSIISDRDYKFTFKDASMESNDDLEVLDYYKGSYAEIKYKMTAQHEVWKVISKYAKETHEVMFSIDGYNYIDAIRSVIKEYLKDDEDIEIKDIFKFDEFNKKYKRKNYKAIEEKLSDGQSCNPEGQESQLFIPFASIFGDKMIIFLESQHQTMDIDHYIIVGLLYVFEQFIAQYQGFAEERKSVKI